jgi:hypothetical protein
VIGVTGNYQGTALLSTSYDTFFSLGKLHMQMKLLGITIVDFDVIDQQLIRFFVPGRY